MDENKLKQDIEAIVIGIFSEKEKAGQVQRTQEALNESAETIENLTQTLITKEAELAEAKVSTETELAEKNTKISDMTAELEAAKAKIEGLEASLVETKNALEGIEKDRVAEARMEELKTEKVAITSDLKTQTAKVRDMNDDDFNSYKNDRIELRNAVAAELEAASAAVKLAAEATKETASTGVKTVVTPPVEIPVGQAQAAAMNFENKPSDDMLARYAKMGAALAANLKSDK